MTKLVEHELKRETKRQTGRQTERQTETDGQTGTPHLKLPVRSDAPGLRRT